MTKIVWFTGLSGTGKTTLSKLLNEIKKINYTTKLIDGDNFRRLKKIQNKFNKKNIIYNNLQIIKYISKFIGRYDYIVLSVISPLKQTRAYARKHFGNNYFEIYLKCKISTLLRRDVKGLYKLASEGKVKNLIGFNSKIKYEESNYKVLKIFTDKLSISKSIKLILNKII